MSRSTVGFAHEPWSEKIVPCAVCGRDGFLLTREAPTRPVYCTSALRGVLDINCTWENRGHAILRPSLRESVLSHPWIIVTPKVYRILRDAGVTEVDFHPIRVEDG
jgi:hypothetical protein